MVLAIVIAFTVLKILSNVVSMQKSLLTNNYCLKKQNYEKDQCDLTFIFTELSGTPNSFVKIRLVFEI